jgi:hypothetical protein
VTDVRPGDDAVVELERTARQLLDAGCADTELRLALEELVADRTNGESLEPACARLSVAIERATPAGPGDAQG